MSTETTSAAEPRDASFTDSAVSVLRTALGLYGVLALVIGIMILVWPGKTAVVVTAIIAIYAIIGGAVYAGLGVFSKIESGWSRVGHIALGALYVIAGVIALLNLGATTVWLAAFIGILVGIMWIIEGIVSLSTLGGAKSKGWTVFFAIVSIIAGLVLLFSPLYAIATLWWLIGIMLVVIGVMQIVRAFTFGKGDVVL
ncbi:HdeD family acid-resistance protein [Cumulibacter soli]|uniref:HdeD family acid-resistance protein n=1 Tax=Cumulibacter soli TaxID=2546344 RepID=UPI0010683C08|nr:DUF308 domain-containing protein [Cumulibacter soli]